MNLSNKRPAATTPGSTAFKLSPVAAGCAVFMALATHGAYAQDTSGQDAAAIGATNSSNVVKVTGMLRTGSNFGDHPRVMDGCTQLLLDVFGENGQHARTSVGMASLPFGAAIEIDMIAYRPAAS